MATLTGDIGLMPVGDLIIWIANRGLTGTFMVKKRGCDSRFVIRDGQLWQGASLDPREYLGQHLINFGYISEDQLQKAFDTQQETHVPLGRVLVMVDAVKQDLLERVLLFKTRESLLEAMSWTEGSFKLIDEVPETTELDTATAVDLHEAHSEALARAQMWNEIRSVFPSDATRVEALIDPGHLSGFDKKLVQLMAAGRSIGEASLELRSMDFQTYARLYDLYNRKAVRPRLAPVESQPPSTQPLTRALTPPPRGQRTGTPKRTTTPQPQQVQQAQQAIARAPTPQPSSSQKSAASPASPASQMGRSPTPQQQPGAYAAMSPPPTTHNERPTPFAGAAPKATMPSSGAGIGPSTYVLVRPEKPAEAPGVLVPAEAQDPTAALRVALAGRNWSDALLLAQRIIELDPVNTEAIAAWRVAEAQLKKSAPADEAVDLKKVPRLAMPREQVALTHLTSKERYVLSRVDGRRSLQQIAAVSPIQKEELVRIVNAFISRGVLKLE